MIDGLSIRRYRKCWSAVADQLPETLSLSLTGLPFTRDELKCHLLAQFLIMRSGVSF